MTRALSLPGLVLLSVALVGDAGAQQAAAPTAAAPTAAASAKQAAVAPAQTAPVVDTAADSAAVAARRAQILAIARAYAEHQWFASEDNVLHGGDADGIHVDTPDVGHRQDGWRADGTANTGVPYKWGGFSSLEGFDAAVAAGAPAGQLTDGVNLDASLYAVGVDCSGFVARCWNLPVKQSTRSLGRLCYELDSYDQLRPGDLINKFDAHAQVFVEFVDAARTQVRVLEAALPKVRESVYPREALERSGFRPFRYKPLDARWVDVEPAPDSAVVDWSRALGEGHFEAQGEARTLHHDDDPAGLVALLASLGDPLADAAPGDWCRYALTGDAGPAVMQVSRVLAAVAPDGLTLQAELGLGEAALSVQEHLPRHARLDERLLTFDEQGQAYDTLQVVQATVEEGHWLQDGQRLRARRLLLHADATMLMRTNVVPISLTVEAVVSPQLPMEGVIELSLQRTWHLPSGDELGSSLRRLVAAGG